MCGYKQTVQARARKRNEDANAHVQNTSKVRGSDVNLLAVTYMLPLIRLLVGLNIVVGRTMNQHILR